MSIFSIPKDMSRGATHSSNFGLIEILEYTNKSNVLVRFKNTGYQTKAGSSNIRRGKVRDLLSPTVYGVGYLGIGDAPASISNRSTREYNLWCNMLRRCYCPKKHAEHPTYKGCAVSSRWLCFQSFYEDLPKIPNYELWLNDRNYQLDKDIKVEGNKTYSLYTCMFVTSQENVAHSIMKRVSKKH